jgi:hypothetical protein
MTSPEQADEWDTFKAWVPAHWDRATTACAWSTWQERARLAAVALHPQPPDVHLAQAQGHAPAAPSADTDEAVRVAPRWTVRYNIAGGAWVGTGWEFFDDESEAQKRYDALIGHCPCKRPYHKNDMQHLGAAHQWAMKEQQP